MKKTEAFVCGALQNTDEIMKKSKMHLVTIHHKGNTYTAFVTIPDGAAVISFETVNTVAEGKINYNSTFGIG